MNIVLNFIGFENIIENLIDPKQNETLHCFGVSCCELIIHCAYSDVSNIIICSVHYTQVDLHQLLSWMYCSVTRGILVLNTILNLAEMIIGPGHNIP